MLKYANQMSRLGFKMDMIVYQIFSQYHLKSMKFFLLCSAILGAALCSQAQDCGEGKVPNQLNVCIEPVYMEGCYQYQSAYSCSVCEPGYKISDRKCNALEFAEREAKINGCLAKSQDRKTCLNCANGFLLKDGTCKKGIKNCAKYNSDDNCKECKDNFSLVLNQCKYNILLGCRKVKTDDHTCQQCWPPFTLKDFHCEIEGCQSLNDYGCTTCQCGYYLNKDRKCLKSEDGCLRYERGRCINCLNHYKLKGGACQIEGCVKYHANQCVECKSSYVNVHGGCEFQNCVDWSNDQCFSCKKGYKAEGGVCEKEDQLVCTD